MVDEGLLLEPMLPPPMGVTADEVADVGLGLTVTVEVAKRDDANVNGIPEAEPATDTTCVDEPPLGSGTTTMPLAAPELVMDGTMLDENGDTVMVLMGDATLAAVESADEKVCKALVRIGNAPSLVREDAAGEIADVACDE